MLIQCSFHLQEINQSFRREFHKNRSYDGNVMTSLFFLLLLRKSCGVLSKWPKILVVEIRVQILFFMCTVLKYINSFGDILAVNMKQIKHNSIYFL